EARPEACDRTARRGRSLDDIAPVEHPLQPLLDLVGRIAFRELAHQGLRALAVLSDRFHQRAIEFAVQKEFSMLGIEADSRRRQDIGGKVRRELQDILAGLLRRAAIAFGGHRVSTRDCLASWKRRRIANVRLPAVCTGSRASIFRPEWKYKASKPLSGDAPQAYTWNWPGRWSIPARKRRLRCAISGRVRSAEAAIAPGYTARANNAAAATATAARTATATAATATTAAATATAVCHLLEAGVAAFLVEEVERGEADVGDFFFAEQ